MKIDPRCRNNRNSLSLFGITTHAEFPSGCQPWNFFSTSLARAMPAITHTETKMMPKNQLRLRLSGYFSARAVASAITSAGMNRMASPIKAGTRMRSSR